MNILTIAVNGDNIATFLPKSPGRTVFFADQMCTSSKDDRSTLPVRETEVYFR